jgi:hypothetical protein
VSNMCAPDRSRTCHSTLMITVWCAPCQAPTACLAGEVLTSPATPREGSLRSSWEPCRAAPNHRSPRCHRNVGAIDKCLAPGGRRTAHSFVMSLHIMILLSCFFCTFCFPGFTHVLMFPFYTSKHVSTSLKQNIHLNTGTQNIYLNTGTRVEKHRV